MIFLQLRECCCHISQVYLVFILISPLLLSGRYLLSKPDCLTCVLLGVLFYHFLSSAVVSEMLLRLVLIVRTFVLVSSPARLALSLWQSICSSVYYNSPLLPPVAAFHRNTLWNRPVAVAAVSWFASLFTAHRVPRHPARSLHRAAHCPHHLHRPHLRHPWQPLRQPPPLRPSCAPRPPGRP